MKKIYFLIAIMLLSLSIHSSAQLNYLFSATTKPYVPVTNGIVPHLINSGQHEPADEGGATIPVGFTFKYNGKNYTQANVNANGYITLGNPPDGYYIFYVNNLKRGPFGTLYQRPLLAPLWDDLYIVDTANLVYKTTGFAPFRVFTIEWKKAKWSYDALMPALSIELKLYETTNIIEFHYKDEGGIPDTFAYASIGITAANINRDFISLQNASSHPGISLLKAMDSIKIKPANNQVYRFIPATLKAPANFRKNYSYTNKTVSLKLRSDEVNNYEYAVTQSPVAPSSGTTTFSSNITISSLSPATTYYVYARSKLFNFLYSQWVCDSFTTQVKPASPPYILNTTQTDPITYLPEDVRTQDFQDTSIFNDFQFEWYAGTDFPNPGDNFIYYNKVQGYFDNDAWAFTRGIKLTGGKTYRLKFSYIAYYYYNPGELGSLEVKYGTGAGFKGMNSGLLFKKKDINSNDPLTDTTIEFTPAHSDVYYFGFHDFTAANEGSPIIVNVSINEKETIPLALSGKTNNADNILNWITDDPGNMSALELQRSMDGLSFTRIKAIDFKTMTTTKTGNYEIFKIHSGTNMTSFPYDNKNKSKAQGEKNNTVNKEMAIVKPWIERINISKDKYSHSASLNAKTNSLNDNNYVDRNANDAYYYRLQQTDKKGNVSYSNVIKLGSRELTTIYPNPVKDILYIKPGLITASKMNIQVTNIAGEILINKRVESFSKTNMLQLNVSHLTAGTYILKISCDSGCENRSKTFIKQ